MNRIILSTLLLPLAVLSATPRVMEDSPNRWRASWSLLDWKCDSSAPSRRIDAPAFPTQRVPGALRLPVIEAVVALPPNGTWRIDVVRDSGVTVAGGTWSRVKGWAANPIRPVDAPPFTPPAWTVESVGNARLLRLSIPWGELAGQELRLARRIEVVLEMTGSGNAGLPRAVAAMVANPSGSSRFGIQSRGAGMSARSMGRSATRLVPDGLQTLVLTMRNPSVGDIVGDKVLSISGEQARTVLGSLSGVDFDRVAVSAGAFGPIKLGADSTVPAPGMPLIPIRRVDKDGDGVFDAEDRIEFFATGPAFWNRDHNDSALGTTIKSLVIHPWDLSRRYIVRLDATQGSSEIAIGAAPASSRAFPTTLRPSWAGRHLATRVPELGQNGTPDHESGSHWFWHWVDTASLDSAKLHHPGGEHLPGLVGAAGTAVVRFAGVALTNTNPSELDTLRTIAGPSNVDRASGPKIAWNVTGLREHNNGWRWNTTREAQDFESYTVHYQHAPAKGSLIPFPAPMAGAFSLQVKDATLSDSVIAVERGVGVRILPLTGGRLLDSARTDETWYVQAAATTAPSTSLARWRASSTPNVLTPTQMSGSVSAAMVIVAPDSFVDLASQHAAFRSDSRRIRPLETKVVRTEDLWLLWGRGSQDPLAIRDMLRYARDHWGTTHVLLMGGGHYDARGLTGTAPGPVPVWQDYEIGTDAVFAYLDPFEMDESVVQTSSRIADIAVGRIPARSRSEVSATLDKIRLWEDPSVASLGPWRNNFLAAADDMMVRSGGGSPDEIQNDDGHTVASERIMGSISAIRPWAQFRKIYEVEYPFNAVLEKPDAQRALLDQLNRGVAAMQFMGHGGFDILTDERLLDTRSALAGLNNSRTPFIFYAGSCTVGRFDLSTARGFAEALLVAAGKGTVASVAGMRPSYPSDNETLAKAFWTSVLSKDGAARPRTIGEAFQLANNSFASGAKDMQGRYPNSSVYNLLGDPGMVPFPAGSPITLDGGLDTLAALDIRKLSGTAESEVQVSLVAPPIERTAQYISGNATYKQSYVLPGRTLVSLRTKAVNGRYDARLITPARIPFGDTASLFLYGWNPSTLRDSAVLDTQVLLSGVGQAGSTDNVGPRIRVLPCDSSWSGGQPFGRIAEIPLPFCLNIFFDDSSGISSSDGPDEGVVLSVPGTLDPWHPTELGEGKDFTQAWTRLSLSAGTFAPGRTYPLQIFARDLMGNASSTTLELHTRSAGEIDLYEVFNRPNPAKGTGTTFYFKLLSDADSNGVIPSSVQASIRIHTISGKLVRILRTDLSQVGHPRPRAMWDLKDSFRNEVANGLYPYTVILRVKDAEGRNWKQLVTRGVVAVSR